MRHLSNATVVRVHLLVELFPFAALHPLLSTCFGLELHEENCVALLISIAVGWVGGVLRGEWGWQCLPSMVIVTPGDECLLRLRLRLYLPMTSPSPTTVECCGDWIHGNWICLHGLDVLTKTRMHLQPTQVSIQFMHWHIWLLPSPPYEIRIWCRGGMLRHLRVEEVEETCEWLLLWFLLREWGYAVELIECSRAVGKRCL